jgi:hypothetical protein
VKGLALTSSKRNSLLRTEVPNADEIPGVGSCVYRARWFWRLKLERVLVREVAGRFDYECSRRLNDSSNEVGRGVRLSSSSLGNSGGGLYIRRESLKPEVLLASCRAGADYCSGFVYWSG